MQWKLGSCSYKDSLAIQVNLKTGRIRGKHIIDIFRAVRPLRRLLQVKFSSSSWLSTMRAVRGSVFMGRPGPSASNKNLVRKSYKIFSCSNGIQALSQAFLREVKARTCRIFPVGNSENQPNHYWSQVCTTVHGWNLMHSPCPIALSLVTWWAS